MTRICGYNKACINQLSRLWFPWGEGCATSCQWVCVWRLPLNSESIWPQLLIKIRASLLSFLLLFGLFASILDSVRGHPQLPGTRVTREVGVVQRARHGLWGQPIPNDPCMTFTKWFNLWTRVSLPLPSRPAWRLLVTFGFYALGVVSDFLI